MSRFRALLGGPRHRIRLSRRMIPLLLLLTSTLLVEEIAAQERSFSYPRAEDVETLDGIVRAFYDVVSGPAGEPPDRERDESLHFPGARIGISAVRTGGEPVLVTMTLDGYHERYGGVRNVAFFEWEIHRETQRFGNIAHVWSTYVTSDRPGGEVDARGINSMQLFFDGARWWITGWSDQRESDANTIPSGFLPPTQPQPG